MQNYFKKIYEKLVQQKCLTNFKQMRDKQRRYKGLWHDGWVVVFFKW